jgi:S-methyl-5-thioribose kinase
MTLLFDHHVLLNCNTVIDYVFEKTDYFTNKENLDAKELSDGNINYVFKVWDTVSGKSLVVKQADKYLRSSGRPLDVKRNKIEAEILQIEGKLAPGFVPEVYLYDDKMNVLVMEDISKYLNLRKELLLGKTFDFFAEEISTFISKTLVPTTDLILDRHEKKEWVQKFINIELCDISEDLVFTEPYYNYKNRNIHTEENASFIQKVLYEDDVLKEEVGLLRNNFMNNAQALVHGDLHSGSIFINENGIKVIDPEFAFYGPMGYDIGNVIGNLFFAWAYAEVQDTKNTKFIEWISSTIEKVLDLSMTKIKEHLTANVKLPLYNSIFLEKYVTSIREDSIGYAGTEIVRRTVGDSKVQEIYALEDLEKVKRIERLLTLFGTDLIKNRKIYETGKELTNSFKRMIDIV